MTKSSRRRESFLSLAHFLLDWLWAVIDFQIEKGWGIFEFNLHYYSPWTTILLPLNYNITFHETATTISVQPQTQNCKPVQMRISQTQNCKPVQMRIPQTQNCKPAQMRISQTQNCKPAQMRISQTQNCKTVQMRSNLHYYSPWTTILLPLHYNITFPATKTTIKVEPQTRNRQPIKMRISQCHLLISAPTSGGQKHPRL